MRRRYSFTFVAAPAPPRLVNRPSSRSRNSTRCARQASPPLQLANFSGPGIDHVRALHCSTSPARCGHSLAHLFARGFVSAMQADAQCGGRCAMERAAVSQGVVEMLHPGALLAIKALKVASSL